MISIYTAKKEKAQASHASSPSLDHQRCWMVFCVACFLAYTLYIENASNMCTLRTELLLWTSSGSLGKCCWSGPVSQCSIGARCVVYIPSCRREFARESTAFVSGRT